MKKLIIGLLVLICIASLISCGTLKIDTPEAINIYSNLSGFKGLELYIWADSRTNQFYCGLLEGTNRNKDEKDYKILGDNPVTVEKMADILGGYNKDMFAIVIGLDEALSINMVTVLKSNFDKLQMPNILYKTNN